MRPRLLVGASLLILTLLWVVPIGAQPSSEVVIIFYRDGQVVPVARSGAFSGNLQTDAGTLLSLLVAGPTPAERASGLTSALPPGTELVAVTVSGDSVTADLRIPSDLMRTELHPDLSDALVDQITKTLYPLDLVHVHIRAEDENGDLLPMSDFLPRPSIPLPALPVNEDAAPDRPGPLPSHVGQPPAFGQGQPQGALSGTTAWLSAGHGWYWDEGQGDWITQRVNYHGIVEDFSNAEAVNYYLARYLWNAGAEVWLVRERAMTPYEIIVDNDDGPPGYTETGSWATTALGGTGYNGSDYRYTTTYAQPATATATWIPDLPAAGWYPVWAWYRHGDNRPTDAHYEIHHAGGVTTVSISQEVHGQTWRYLGEYYFEAGTAGQVTLLNQSDDPGQAVIADAMRFGGGLGSIEEPAGSLQPTGLLEPVGPSGRPRWEEAAKYWARYQGAPPEVSAYDVTSRPLYAEWETAKGYPGEAENAVFISWHSNGYDGILSGTMSFIHDTEPTPGSAALQDWVHAELVSDLRAAWDPGWPDLNQRSADYGELRELATIPGVLLEVAFHDSPSDANALREPVFRQIAARAVFQGIVKYQAERQGSDLDLLPEPPERLVARNSAPGEVTLSWAPPACCDGVLGQAATGYKVYHSTNGRGFDDGVVTANPSLTLSGLPPGSLHFFRVTALNDGGESFPTPVVAARTPLAGTPVSFLVVDGFDRLDQAALIPQWESPALGTVQRMFLEQMNRYDYAVEHGQALDACNLAFDGAVNEAVEAGTVGLADYPAVDWFVGEDSVADAALSDVERTLLAAYLDGGGRLLISGSEIGYDLVDQGRDPGFYHDYLHAGYLGDDAGTHQFAGVAGGIFEGLTGSFDDGTGGTYDVGYPDRLDSAAGAAVAVDYVGGTGSGAAVVYDGDSRVVHFCFPLETVNDPAVRTALFCNAATFLLPGTEPPPGSTQRAINPGFEHGLAQSAWQATSSGGDPIFSHRLDLPATVEPHGGDWLAWLGGYTPGITVTTNLTQTIGLPSGEPTATLSLAWFVHTGGSPLPGGSPPPGGGPLPNDDSLSAGLYDLEGVLQSDLLTLTNQSPADHWQTATFDLSAFSGETVQIAFRATSGDTAFFVDDVSLATAGPRGPDEYRALWMDAYHAGIKDRQQLEELVETARAGNFNALVVQVRRRGDTYYPSSIDPWAPDATPGFDALAYLIERAHAAGIEVHAWATTLAIWEGSTPPAAPDHTFNAHGPGATGGDYWLMLSDTGGDSYENVTYLDPGHPDVVDYTVAVYAELAETYELDGLHLDRVRYPDQNWGYNPTSLARFQAQTGRADTPPPADGQWLQWRRDQVTALVRRIYLTVTAINPGLRASAALSVAGWPPSVNDPWETRTPFTHHLQDWRSWLEEGILDLALPMTYRDQDSYPNQFTNWIEWEKDHQYDRGLVVGTGLYLNDVPDSMAQWARVREPSAAGNLALGITGFSYATPSDDGTPRRSFVNATVTEVFTRTASPPAIAWKDAPTLGHLAGRLVEAVPCRDLDAYPVDLTGPVNRPLLTDGSAWFGAVDLPPGQYLLSVDVLTPSMTLQVPVPVTAGAVTQEEIRLPYCSSERVHLPLVLKSAGP